MWYRRVEKQMLNKSIEKAPRTTIAVADAATITVEHKMSLVTNCTFT